jgi:RND superfamily putative drug exporter
MPAAKRERQMTGELLDLPTAALTVVITFGAVLTAGAAGQAWLVLRSAVGLSVVLSHVLAAGVAGAVLVIVTGAVIGLDRALAMLNEDRRRRAKLARRPRAWHLLANRSLTTTGHSVALSGAAIIVSIAALHLAVHEVVGLVPAGSPVVVVLALMACLPLTPALLLRAGVRPPGAARVRAGIRAGMRAVPHDPRAGLLLSAVAALTIMLAAFAL